MSKRKISTISTLATAILCTGASAFSESAFAAAITVLGNIFEKMWGVYPSLYVVGMILAGIAFFKSTSDKSVEVAKTAMIGMTVALLIIGLIHFAGGSAAVTDTLTDIGIN